ncbi:MAG: ribosome assembly factor SBDS [Candidatus Micrarchaeota archaeon]
MISLDNAVIAKYKRDEMVFEILVDPDKARDFKSNTKVSLDDVVVAKTVFADSRKGEKAPESSVNKVFGTNNFDEVAKQILLKGEIQLTTEQKKKMLENKKKQIVAMICKSAVDPRTHIPHPQVRIEKAIEEAKVHIDAMRPADAQIDDIVKKLKPILPIRLEIVRVAVRTSARYGGQVCGFVRSYKMMSENWQSDGSYTCVVEISAGLQGEFLDKLNKVTHGDVDVKVVEHLDT